MEAGRRWLFARVCLALLSPLACVIALVPLRAHVLNTNLALVLVLVVLGAAVAGGRAAGLAAALSAALAYDFFLTVPYGSFTMERGDDIETTVLLGLSASSAGACGTGPHPRPGMPLVSSSARVLTHDVCPS